MTLQTVLVTGGCGFIGSHIVLRLLETRQFKVISIDNNESTHPLALVRVEEIARDSLPADASEEQKAACAVDKIAADLRDTARMKEIFASYGHGGIHAVIHIAAYKSVGDSNRMPLAYYHNNVAASVSLMQTMEEFGCKNLVFSSSGTVYGKVPAGMKILETHQDGMGSSSAISPYGRSKQMCERIMRDLCASNDSWRAISLRYFNPAGSHPSGRIGEDPVGRPGNLIPLLAQMAGGRVKEGALKVFGSDYDTRDGTAIRDYIHIIDLADGHILALEAMLNSAAQRESNGSDIFSSEPTNFKAFNLGIGNGATVLEVVEAMKKASGYPLKTELVARRQGDAPETVADPTRAEKELGFKTKFTLDDMCHDQWNWQTRNPNGYL